MFCLVVVVVFWGVEFWIWIRAGVGGVYNLVAVSTYVGAVVCPQKKEGNHGEHIADGLR